MPETVRAGGDLGQSSPGGRGRTSLVQHLARAAVSGWPHTRRRAVMGAPLWGPARGVATVAPWRARGRYPVMGDLGAKSQPGTQDLGIA